MSTYGQHEYGLYFTGSDLQAYTDANDTDPDEVADEMGAYRHSEAVGFAQPMLIVGGDEFAVDSSFYLLPLERYPMLCEAAYPSFQAALDELKAKAAPFLPNDYDYLRFFVDYLGSICC